MYKYLIICDNEALSARLRDVMKCWQEYHCVKTAANTTAAIEDIIEFKPDVVFVELSLEMQFSFELVEGMHKYLHKFPYLIGISYTDALALNAIRSGFSDYLLLPLLMPDLGNSLFKFEKRYQVYFPDSICIKSYTDYNFIAIKDIIYLKADNSTTDIYLSNGKIVPAYKTLKHFEEYLPGTFFRIHKSYIVNIHYVSRIYISKSKCYLNYNETLPFSETYRINVDRIMKQLESI